MTSRYVLLAVVFLMTAGLSTGCGSGATPPSVNEILAQPGTSLTTGEDINLTADASGTDMQFEWSALRGRISNPALPAVLYTAPVWGAAVRKGNTTSRSS